MIILRTVKNFSSLNIAASILLFLMAILAAVIANSPMAPLYQGFLLQELHLRIGDFNLFSHGGHPLKMIEFINDCLMTVFFLAVGLEIKRELLVGELSSFRKASLPFVAACGGMLVPVIVYSLLVVQGTPETRGMAIPMATDIAFSLGVLSLLGKRVPLSLKIFLTAFAVVDDIGGILVIAIFYSSEVAYEYACQPEYFLFLLYAGWCPLFLPLLYGEIRYDTEDILPAYRGNYLVFVPSVGHSQHYFRSDTGLCNTGPSPFGCREIH